MIDKHQQLIGEITDMLKIPPIEAIIRHKIRHLQIIMNDDISYYASMYEESDNDVKESEQSPVIFGEQVEFFLQRVGMFLWFPQIKGTYEGTNGFKVIPAPAISWIVNHPLETVMMHNLRFKELPGKTCDLSFEKISDSEINGFIFWKSCGAGVSVADESNGTVGDVRDKQDIHDVRNLGNLRKIENVKKMIAQMMEDKEYYNHALREFCHYWQRTGNRKSTASTG